MPVNRLVLVLVPCALAFAAASVRADTCVEKSQLGATSSKDEMATGKVLFTKAKALEKQGKNDEACKMFESSLLLDPQIGTRLNVATCREKAGNLIAARMSFEEVAEEAARTNDPRGDFARERERAIAAQLVKVTVKLAEPDASGLSMRVGECPVTKIEASITRFVRAGKVVVDVSAPGRMSFHKEQQVTPGNELAVDVPALAPEADPEAERKAKEAAQAAEARAAADRKRAEDATEKLRVANRHPARKWALIGGGLGVAALVGGGVFAYLARSTQRDFDAAGCGDRSQLLDPTAYADCKDMGDRGQRNALLANSLMIGGGVALAVSALIFVLDPGHRAQPEEPRRAAVLVTPSSVGVSFAW